MNKLGVFALASVVYSFGFSFHVCMAQSQADVDRINRNFDRIKVGKFQVPGEIQRPGDIQVPKGVQEIKEKCKERLLVSSDTLFEFDKYTLTPKAAAALSALGPVVRQYARHPITIEGHTDAKGNDTYNQKLSEQRAKAVHDWLATNQFIYSTSGIVGYGKKQPVAPNENADGSDNPQGRAKNRRVEIVIDTCH